MKVSVKILSSILSVVFLICTSCGSLFDPVEYTKACLDAIYKGDFTQYTKLVDVSLEEAEQTYQQGYQSEADAFAQRYGIHSLSDATRNQINELYKYLYNKADYQVQNSQDQENGYSVQVTVRPINLFVADQPKITDYCNKFNNDVLNGVYSNLPEQQFEDQYASGILQIFNADKESLSYCDPQALSLQVEKDQGTSNYAIRESDLAQLHQTVILYA